jgi:2-polyprenyl-3-methyl-5-hydroxy-6-metoxy-1,4-benzoquinol methylase
MSATPQFLESSRYTKPGLRGCHDYILPVLLALSAELPPHSRILDVGCGNGSLATEFSKRGHQVTGIDLAESGIRIAREYCPSARFEVQGANIGILSRLGEKPFDLVYSVEVIEHLYDPRSFMIACFEATKPTGQFVCTTPYHGYLKNLVISLASGWDKHADPLFDGGHIKLFSRKKLEALMREIGFEGIQFRGSGRYPYLWKSMILLGTRPAARVIAGRDL